jgi:hypothetical protein
MPDFGGDDLRDALDDAPDVSVDDDAMIGRDDPEPVPARRPTETTDTDSETTSATATDTTGVDWHGDESRASTRRDGTELAL